MTHNGSLYELHYYEFDIELRGDRSYYLEYDPRNILPAEITENLKPQAVIAVGDGLCFSDMVTKYLSSMTNMKFKEEKECYPELHNAQLFYQIFLGSDAGE